MNPTALITGASRGIGRGIALALAPLGWDLLLNFARNEAAARETAEACLLSARQAGCSIRVDIHRADIAAAVERDSLVRHARDFLGRCTLLVNNAGVAPAVRADLLDASEESFDRLIDTNLKGPFLLTQQVARWMIAEQAGNPPHAASAASSPVPPPRIIFVSSISAYTASINRGDYCVSKAGVAMLVKLFAARLAPHGVAVHEIRPGVIATDMTGPVKEKYDLLIAGGLTPIARWGTPSDVGQAVAALARNMFPFSTGDVFNVDGGFHLRTL